MDIKSIIGLVVDFFKWILALWNSLPEEKKEEIINYILEKWKIVLEKYYDWYNET